MDRFCVLGTVEDHISKLKVLKNTGVDQFAIYLMHDAQDETLAAYETGVIPALVRINLMTFLASAIQSSDLLL